MKTIEAIEMNCPVCSKPLTTNRGDSIDPLNGYTIFCNHRDCSAQEVSGHGKTINDAFDILTQKFEIALKNA